MDPLLSTAVRQRMPNEGFWGLSDVISSKWTINLMVQGRGCEIAEGVEVHQPPFFVTLNAKISGRRTDEFLRIGCERWRI